MNKKGLMELIMVLPPLSLYFLIKEKIIECNRSEGESMLPTLPT